MKKIFKTVLTLGLVAGLGFAANAQQTSSAQSSATILSDLTITLDGVQNAIAFGNVSATTPGAIVLDAKGVTNSNTGTATNVARFDLEGANSDVTVSYDATVTLTESVGGIETIIMTPEVVGAVDSGDQASAASVPAEDTVTLVDNAYFLWVGGSIPALSGQSTGTYIGTFNISVEYN